MKEKCGTGGINNMKKQKLVCKNCGKHFKYWVNLYCHEEECGIEGINNMKDNIKPNHYNKGNKDLIEMWYQTMPIEQFRGAMKSNIIKYTMRYENKNGIEDLNKAMEYIERLKGCEENELQK